VVEKLQTSMQWASRFMTAGSRLRLIGTHYRYGKIMNLTDYMAGRARSGRTRLD